MRLPGCFLCYTPSADAPPAAPTPALVNGFITFGSFNALAKEVPEVLAAWAALLHRVPGSRLVLKNKPFACASVREKYWRAFEAHGVARNKVSRGEGGGGGCGGRVGVSVGRMSRMWIEWVHVSGGQLCVCVGVSVGGCVGGKVGWRNLAALSTPFNARCWLSAL